MFYSFLNSPIARGQQYLDPGSGSYLIQLLLAALLGGAYAVKVYWRNIKAFFTRSGKQEDPDQHEQDHIDK